MPSVSKESEKTEEKEEPDKKVSKTGVSKKKGKKE